MSTVSHVPWIYHATNISNSHGVKDIYKNNIKSIKEDIKNNNDFVEGFDDNIDETELENGSGDEYEKNKDKNNTENIVDAENVRENDEETDETNNETQKENKYFLKYKSFEKSKSHEGNDEINKSNLYNEGVLYKETTKRKHVKKINRDSIIKNRRENPTKKPWRLNSGVLVTLVILNVTGQGIAVEVISTNSLASLLGYPSSCTLGTEVRPCTLSLTCWLRGGTRVRGCGGWLFSCCQPPEDSWNSYENNIPSDWQYKVSPPRLKEVPQRNAVPTNVFRRRVDDDVAQVDCGVPSNRVLQKRIIGGREARFAEFPWQAHVRISEFQCGGVLVSQWYVATAAHCVSRAHIRDIVVWLGALDTSAGSPTARKVGVHKKILHPLFQFRMTQPDRYDIALLKLSRPVSFTRHIRAICLPESAMMLKGRTAVIAGWGKTDATDTHTGTNMLRSATVPILSKEQCITWHQSKQISVEIHSEMICAGHSDGHQDACLGDSGGPLIVAENGRYYLVGITSAGFGCGVDHQPGIYHNVQVTTTWIRRVISQPNSAEEHNHYYRI